MNPYPFRLRSLVTAALICAAVAPAHAHEGHHHNAMGTVRAVQATQLDLETKDGKVESFVLTDSTSYKQGDAEASREDLSAGTRAVVMYEAKSGKNVAIEVKLAAGEHEGHGSHGSTASSATLQTPEPAPLSAEEANTLRSVEARLVCMVNNTLFDKPQIPVEVEGKTYFGCCAMCKEKLVTDPASRESMDPISGKMVDKAVAVIGVLPSGSVVYFETEQNLVAYRAKLTAEHAS